MILVRRGKSAPRPRSNSGDFLFRWPSKDTAYKAPMGPFSFAWAPFVFQPPIDNYFGRKLEANPRNNAWDLTLRGQVSGTQKKSFLVDPHSFLPSVILATLIEFQD